MRPHGSANISATRPAALGICDRCGRRANHYRLRWQYDWRGPKLQNLQFLVCDQGCYDAPQENGQRTIVLPADPVPIMNARPEAVVQDDNPLSALGASPNVYLPQYGMQIGNLTGGGGIRSAFDGSANKPAWMSACNAISKSSYNNYVGINWSGNVSNLNMPSSLKPPILKHSLISYTITAPNDRGFLGNSPTSYVVQASPVDTSLYGAWTTISSGVTSGSPGEEISVDCTGPTMQFHRVGVLGDQINFVAVAQVQFSVAQIGEPITTGSS